MPPSKEGRCIPLRKQQAWIFNNRSVEIGLSDYGKGTYRAAEDILVIVTFHKPRRWAAYTRELC